MAIMPLPVSAVKRNHQAMTNLLNKIAARLAGARLDRDLAAGVSPETSDLHAARARQLTSLKTRRTLADSWERLLWITQERRPVRSAKVPPCRDRLQQAAPEIRELVVALRATGPVPARGVAIAMGLLVDGCGPVYNPRTDEDVVELLLGAVAELDPELPLITGAIQLSH
jgi:hypothetical protein